MDGLPQDPGLRSALSLIYKVLLDMLNIVLSVINADHVLKYSVIYAQARSPGSWAHKSSVQICSGEHFPQAGWRVNKKEGTSKHEREQGRKAKIGGSERKRRELWRRREVPIALFLVCVAPSVGQQDTGLLLQGKGLWMAPPCHGSKGVCGTALKLLALLFG